MTDAVHFRFEELPAEVRLSIYDQLFKSTTRNNWHGLRMANKASKAEIEYEYHKHLVAKLKDHEEAISKYSHIRITPEYPTQMKSTYHINIKLEFKGGVSLRPGSSPALSNLAWMMRRLVTLDVETITLKVEGGRGSDLILSVIRELNYRETGKYRRDLPWGFDSKWYMRVGHFKCGQVHEGVMIMRSAINVNKPSSKI